MAHLAGHLSGPPEPANEQERTLLDLMTNYKTNMGGVERSTLQIFNGFSLAFSVFLVFAALAAFLAARLRDDAAVRTGAVLAAALSGIQLALAIVYFIPPPIVCFAVAFACFVAAIATLRRPPAPASFTDR
jgi:heme A synthase